MPPQASKAKDVMLEGASLHVNDRGRTLVKKLSGRYHALPVVNDNREVVGIVSEHNVLDALREQKSLFQCSAKSLMSCGHVGHEYCRKPVVVTPETPVHDVLRTMFREQLSIVPVVEDRKLVGLIERKDIMIA